jgi:hypothetical protein
MGTPQIRQNNLQPPQAETDALQTDGPGRKNVIARKRCRRERTSESPAVKGAINYTQKGSSQSHFRLICNRQGEHSNWPFESALSAAWLLMEIDIARECDPFSTSR